VVCKEIWRVVAAKLTAKQQKFIDEYLQCFNATEAARRAGYNANNGTMRVIGCENLAKPNIKEAIAQHFNASAMSAEEALQRLADQARGNIGDFADIESGSDLAKHPQSHIVKKFKKRIYRPKNGDPYEEIELEMYDAHAPLVDIGKHHAIFIDKVEHSGEVTTGSINIIVEMPSEEK
jgi:phage terminase small subunit